MKLFPTKQMAALCQVTRETFQSWHVRVAERRGRTNYYALADVLENRAGHREDVIRAEYARKERRNGASPEPLDEDFETALMDELAEWVSKTMFPMLWDHPSMWAGVMGYAVEEQELTVEQAWHVMAFCMIQMSGAVTHGFRREPDDLLFEMPPWFAELRKLGPEKYPAVMWKRAKKLNDEWHKQRAAD